MGFLCSLFAHVHFFQQNFKEKTVNSRPPYLSEFVCVYQTTALGLNPKALHLRFDFIYLHFENDEKKKETGFGLLL